MAHYQPGRYRCKIVNQGFGNSSKKGTPYFFFTFQPISQLDGEDEYRCQDVYERDVLLYLTDKTVEGVVQKLRELGWQGNDWSELDPQMGDHVSFAGEVVELSCEHEQNDDKVYERWQFPFSGSGMEHKREPDTVRKINALFGKALKGGKPASQPAKKQAPKQTVPPERDEDPEIPF